MNEHRPGDADDPGDDLVGASGDPAPVIGRRPRHAAQVLADSLAWVIGMVLAELARYDFTIAERHQGDLAILSLIAVVLAIPVGYAFGLYTGRYRFGSFDEVAALVRSIGVVAFAVFALNLALGRPLPASVPIAGGLVALLLCAALRYTVRLTRERRLRPNADERSRLIVLGAGDGGTQVVGALLRQPTSEYVPVALLDDDPDKRRLRIMGIPVEGTSNDVERVAAAHDADTLLIAIPSAPASLIRDVSDAARLAGLDVRVLPPVNELFGIVTVADIRPPTPADLIGRKEIETDVESIAQYMRGRRVLVTGAGGSIGSELCRQIARYEPAELVLLDHDESNLLACQLTLDGVGRLESPNLVVASIRDRERIDDVFATHRPEVVFHVAALKHVPLLELNPGEAVSTNVAGTRNVLDAALRANVERFVNVSTDKAADPMNVLGRTKRIAERMTAHAGERATGAYLSVRFGNVLGSRGSVLETFRAQIEAGGPVVVTSPTVTRFFMTCEEAVQLTIQAGAVGRSGEVLVLDVGEPVRIADLAQRLVADAGREIEIVYTGLRLGEREHETLFGSDETPTRPSHPLISHCDVPPIPPEEVDALVALHDPDAIRRALVAVREPDASRLTAR
jgi:FlaA1/EpsC-like NDP-sugar epimerase